MADEDKKGVSVKLTYSPGSAFHEQGTDVRVADGHLIVTHGSANSGEIVAVYAPGSWRAARVTR